MRIPLHAGWTFATLQAARLPGETLCPKIRPAWGAGSQEACFRRHTKSWAVRRTVIAGRALPGSMPVRSFAVKWSLAAGLRGQISSGPGECAIAEQKQFH